MVTSKTENKVESNVVYYVKSNLLKFIHNIEERTGIVFDDIELTCKHGEQISVYLFIKSIHGICVADYGVWVWWGEPTGYVSVADRYLYCYVPVCDDSRLGFEIERCKAEITSWIEDIIRKTKPYVGKHNPWNTTEY